MRTDITDMSLRSLDRMLEGGAGVRECVITQLKHMQHICNAKMREPVHASDFARRELMRDACMAAQRVVEIVWERNR